MTFYIKTAEGWKPWVAAIPVCGNSNDLQGVYRPTSHELCQRKLAAHAAAFCDILANGSMRQIKDFNYRLHGAFGEKL